MISLPGSNPCLILEENAVTPQSMSRRTSIFAAIGVSGLLFLAACSTARHDVRQDAQKGLLFDDRPGRGCPIPYGDESMNPDEGKYLQIYSPHVYVKDLARLDIEPKGADARLTIDGEAAETLKRNQRYILTFSNTGMIRNVKFGEYLAKPKIDKSPASVRPSKGDATVDGYRNPGMTIYSATNGTIAFGLRVNGWSLPVTISQ
jgi:hypothetical protein